MEVGLMVEDKIDVDIKDPDEILVAEILGYEIYFTQEVLDETEEKFPDKEERKHYMDNLLCDMIPTCRARREWEERKKK